MGKEIPIALIVLIMGQTATGVWWAATQTTKLDALTEMVSEFRRGQYTQEDARRDKEFILQRSLENARRIEALERMVEKRVRS